MNDCVFCKIVQKVLPASIVYEDAVTIAFLDIKPINRGHLLVIPKKHTENATDTPNDTLFAMVATAKKLTAPLLRTTGAAGYNLGMNNGSVSGQAVMHAHLHIIPRYPDDGLLPWKNKETTTQDLDSVHRRLLVELM